MNPPIIIIYNIIKELYDNWIQITFTLVLTGVTLLICLRLLEYVTKTLAMSIL